MTPKQAIFYGEYIKDGNATRAARVAGAPEASAHVEGCRMLKNAKVAAAIKAWREREQAKYEITADRVLQELYKLATYDAKNLYDQDGNRLPVHLLDDVTRAAVCDVEDETTQTTKDEVTTVKRRQRIKMAEKGQNLERLGKYFKLFGDGSFGATVDMPGGLPADSSIKIVLVRPA